MTVDVSAIGEGTNALNASCSCTPPDPSGAAGPTHEIETTNNSIAIYDKAGNLVSRRSLTSFLSLGLSGVRGLTDPVVMYDDINNQWVVGDLEATSPRNFDVAISFDSDPTDGFYYARYGLNPGADYPRAGFNFDQYTFSFNQFVGSTVHVDVLSIDKTTLAGFRNTVPGSHFTMAPATMHQANPGDPQWFVERGGASNTMRIIQGTNMLSFNPTFSTTNVLVPSWSGAPAPAQPGGSLPGFDPRIFNADYVGGLLVAGHTIGQGGRAVARWYEFDTTTINPSLVQAGNIDQGPGVSTFFPTVAFNLEGDIGMTFMESSSSEFLSMYVTGQSINDIGSVVMQTPVVTHPGTSFYSSTRIGDFSGISYDPADTYSFWGFNEYKGNTSWNTGVAGFGVSPNGDGPVASRIQPGRIVNAISVALSSASATQETTPVTVVDSTSSTVRPAQAPNAVLVDGLFERMARMDVDMPSTRLVRTTAVDNRLFAEEIL
jgi:hypothetical protein